MFTPTIENMTPEKVMRRQPFRRVRPSDSLTALGDGIVGSFTGIEGKVEYSYPTYADFIREQDVNGHRIMSTAWYPDITGYDEEKKRYFTRKVARVTTNLPEVFASQRTSMLTGDRLDIKLVSGGDLQEKQDLLSELLEMWEYKDMEKAVYDLIWTCNTLADCAIVFYLDGGKLGWRRLSYADGDIVYPHYNSYGRLCLFGRRYNAIEDGVTVEYLEVWDDTRFARYKCGPDAENGGANMVWELDGKPANHGFKRCPVAYHNSGDTVSGPAMGLLDSFDLAMSQLCENNKAYALRIFYALGADVDISASIDGRPMTVTSTDVNSKVGFLEPAEASGSFELQMKQLLKAAYQAAHCTEPTEIKSGADISSLTVQMLSKDSYHQALLDAKEFQPAINDIVELFKYGCGVELAKLSKFETLRIKGTINPYIMRSEVEEVNNISILRNAGAIPVKAAANEAARLGYGTPRNYEEIQQEEHDALVAEQKAQQSAVSTTARRNPVAESRTTGDA